MKVLLVNGSPHEKGCTFTALTEIAATLNQEGIDTEFFYIGTAPIAPCKACRACAKLGHCVVDDKVNIFLERAKTADGYVFGSPVHYASASGVIVPFLDRAFFADYLSGTNTFPHKPATAVVSARRAGTTATIDQLHKHFQITQMPVISGRYWNMVHGHTPEDVRQDLEGMQNMRMLARNFAYHLKCREAAEKTGIFPPKDEEVVYTNFIR